MIREVRKVGSKGQVVIPKVFRDNLGIKPGENVDIAVEDDKVIIQRQTKETKPVLERIAKQSEDSAEDTDEAYQAMRDQRWTKST